VIAQAILMIIVFAAAMAGRGPYATDTVQGSPLTPLQLATKMFTLLVSSLVLSACESDSQLCCICCMSQLLFTCNGCACIRRITVVC
jgi:hypothetical protein